MSLWSLDEAILSPFGWAKLIAWPCGFPSYHLASAHLANLSEVDLSLPAIRDLHRFEILVEPVDHPGESFPSPGVGFRVQVGSGVGLPHRRGHSEEVRVRRLVGHEHLRNALDVLIGDGGRFGGIPLAVGLCLFDSRASVFRHETAFLEFRSELLVFLRPLAVGASPAEVLAIGGGIYLLHLAVDPAEAECFLKRFRCRERFRATRFAKDEPRALIGRAMSREPAPEI